MVPASLLILAMVIFTGFVIPVDYMLGWCRWINYLDPVAYGFEALMINEFHGREFVGFARMADDTPLTFLADRRIAPGTDIRLAADKERVLVFGGAA